MATTPQTEGANDPLFTGQAAPPSRPTRTAVANLYKRTAATSLRCKLCGDTFTTSRKHKAYALLNTHIVLDHG